jgi:hypothetical protein
VVCNTVSLTGQYHFVFIFRVKEEFDPENGDSRVLQNIDIRLHDYRILEPRKQNLRFNMIYKIGLDEFSI